jgi:hypothetical protein
MHVMFFTVTSNTLDSNQNIIFMILRDFLFYLQTCTIDAHTKLVQNVFSSSIEVHSTILEIELGHENKCHM